jgi:hypothetical protein
MRILFDGAHADLRSVNSDGSLLVSPPPASAGYQAAVEVLSNDWQTSSEALGTTEPPVFSYSTLSTPSISVSAATVTAGTDTLVWITGYNTDFIDGRTFVGFGSSDILVRQVWVLGVGSLLVNISVNAGAPATRTSVSVATGLQLATLLTAFQISAASPGQISMHAPVVNQLTGLAGVPVGGTALINTTGLPQNTTGLPQSLAGWSLLISSQQVSFSLGTGAPGGPGPGQIVASIPSGMLTGPAVVQLIPPNGASIPPIAMEIDPPPPVITSALTSSGQAISGSVSVQSGETITLIVSGLDDSNNAAPAPATVQVNFGGVIQTAATVTQAAQGACAVQVAVPANLPDQVQTPVTLTVGTRVSQTYFIDVQN